MAKVTKKIFTGPKNQDIKEEFLFKHLISHVIGYPSIDVWNSLETYGQPCIAVVFMVAKLSMILSFMLFKSLPTKIFTIYQDVI